jgi:hypothetical protein
MFLLFVFYRDAVAVLFFTPPDYGKRFAPAQPFLVVGLLHVIIALVRLLIALRGEHYLESKGYCRCGSEERGKYNCVQALSVDHFSLK